MSATERLNVEEKCKKRISQRDYSIKEVKMVKRDRYHKVPVVVLRKKSGSMSTVDLESLLSDSDERVRVEFFTNEKSLKERLQLYFIKNQRSSLRIRIFNLVIKLLTCALYIVRVSMDGLSHCQQFPNGTIVDTDDCWTPVDADRFQENPHINWNRILWVNRSSELWIIQVTVAGISLVETILVQYLSYKGNILQQVLSMEFLLELVNTVPFVVTIFWEEPLRNLFIPIFLNCWLAKLALQNMFNDLHRVMMKSQSALAQQLMILCATVLCLVFTSVCGIQHLQRGGNQQFGLFESCWFSVVTFSTVGYGDICPDIWISQFFMICMIGAALIVLPTQFEQLAFFWMERQKQGGAYSSHRAQTEKHVVVCTTTLQADTIMDFLNEFYAHPKLQDYYVVLLSPCELDSTMKMLLQVPLWTQRVIYIQGSALKDSDLTRCRMQDSLACFILAARNQSDRTAADQHTILRSWAIKDFAPDCAQYVQIFRPENKFHVKFAEHVVCEDEFKYALLANNCLCPATSTLVTLLLHTSRGHEGQTSSEDWQRLYGGCSGNEIYHIKLRDSKFFGEYEGKSFTYASFHAHRRFGVSLVGIQQSDVKDSNIQLNPGPRHIMKKSDICFYLNITKEENTRTFNLAQSQEEGGKMDQQNLPTGAKEASKVASMIASVGTVALELQHTRVNIPNPSEITRPPAPTRKDSKKFQLDLPKGLNISSLQKRPSIAPVPAVLEANDIRIQLSSDVESEEEDDDTVFDSETDHDPEYIRGFPPITPYVGTSPTLCHLMKEKRPLCCLQLAYACNHCCYTTTKEYNWPNRAIILAADFASNGIYNFVVPLRSHARPKNTLNPIVLLLGNTPDTAFLDTICHFPLVFWMIGSIDSIDNLLQAGINMADNVVIVNKETSNSAEEDTLSDCNTIVGVQTIFRLFPSANIITELSQSSNMRFMQFRANDTYSYSLSKLEKKERGRGSHLSYMFRLPFAAGNVFSASMLDTLLYQAFVKEYLITFVRLLLGIDQAVGSGHLSCMKIKKEDLWIRTYGRLYQKFCSTTCEIPIGIYRTQVHHDQTGETTSPNASMVVRDQSALNLAFRNSVIRRKPRQSSTSFSSTTKKPDNVSLSMMGLEHDDSDAHMTPERHEISQMVKSRMQSLGLPMSDYDSRTRHRRKRGCGSEKRNNISYVIVNPSYDLRLELDDIIYVIRPSSLSPQASPLLDERKLNDRHTMGKRVEPTGADNSDLETRSSNSVKPNGEDRSNNASTSKRVKGGIMKDPNSRIPIIYMDDDSDEEDNDDNSTQPPAEGSPGSTTTSNGHPLFHLGSIDNSVPEMPQQQIDSPVEGLKGTVV